VDCQDVSEKMISTTSSVALARSVTFHSRDALLSLILKTPTVYAVQLIAWMESDSWARALQSSKQDHVEETEAIADADQAHQTNAGIVIRLATGPHNAVREDAVLAVIVTDVKAVATSVVAEVTSNVIAAVDAANLEA